MSDQFGHVEAEAARLRGEYAASRITQQEYEAALLKLVFLHENRYWMIGAQTGAWYVHEQGGWVEAQPPRPAPALRQDRPARLAQPTHPLAAHQAPPATRPASPARQAQPSELPPASQALAPGEIRRLIGHAGAVNSVGFSPDGQLAASGGDDGTVRLWDLGGGRLLNTMTGHTLAVSAVALHADHVLSGSHDRTVRVWLFGGQEYRRLDHRDAVTSVAFSPDGRDCFSAAEDGIVLRWGIEQNRVFTLYQGHAAAVTGLAVSRDGHRLASIGHDGNLRVWDVASGRETQRIDLGTMYPGPLARRVALSPNGRLAATCSLAASVDLWDLGKGTRLHSFAGPTVNVFDVAFSPDGRQVWACSGSDYMPPGERGPRGHDNLIWGWEMASGGRVACLEGHSGNVNGLAMSPDGHYVLSGSSDATVRLWHPTF